MKKNIRKMAYAALVALTLAACSKSADTPPASEPLKDNAKKVLAYIHKMGFPTASIRDNGDAYVVEEDIVFPKNMEVPNSLGVPILEQYYTGSLVNDANSRNIRLFVDAAMTSMLAEIDTAIARWNRVPNSKVRWVRTTGTYDVRIINSNLGSGVCGQGTFPSGGKAGATIWINKNYIAGNSFEQRQRTIAHEMGHNVSLRHTNWSSRGEPTATPVPGVGGTDASSIMNGGQCGSGAFVFSSKDKLAIAALYPLP